MLCRGFDQFPFRVVQEWACGRLLLQLNMLLFYIKKSIISNPLITLFILFWIICVFTFFVFGIMECHISSDSNQLCKEFSPSNSFWFMSNVIFQRK